VRCAKTDSRFAGLPATGKSAITGAVEERLVAAGRPAFLLDGDNLRYGCRCAI
jgi:bifunctional enzyme CysN/CysC